MRLELDGNRVRVLRERIGMPLARAAELSRIPIEDIQRLERDGGTVDVDVARRLAKAYNRNWYVFLLEDEPGRPALPHDFRRLAAARKIGEATLIAFDDAEGLIEKIADLPREADEPPQVALPNIEGLTPDSAAREVRAALGVTVESQRAAADPYAAIRFWATALSRAGLYVAQLSFPYREIRAFCLRRHAISLIVVSTKDSPRARVFSMLHELGHLLLGSEGMCQPEPPGLEPVKQSEEVFCNAFAAALLMPADEFAADPEARALAGHRIELGDAVPLARRWGVSELAALRRLATVGVLAPEEYQRLHSERAEEFADEPEPDPNGQLVPLRCLVPRRHVCARSPSGPLAAVRAPG